MTIYTKLYAILDNQNIDGTNHYLWMRSCSWQFSLKFVHLQIEPEQEYL